MDKSEISIPKGVFENIKASFDAHDDTCLSLPQYWLGYSGGVTGFNDTYQCTGCEESFWVDDKHMVYVESDDSDDEWCNCCARKAGLIND